MPDFNTSTVAVDAGTALANLSAPGAGRSRNVFYPGQSDLMFVQAPSDLVANVFTVTIDPQQQHEVITKLGREETDWVGVEPTVSALQQITLPLEIWEGVVQDIDLVGGRFFASLSSKILRTDDQLAEIPLSQIEPADYDLLSVGSVFYLEQYQRNWRGGRESAQVLRFRRSALWTKAVNEWIEQEAAELDLKLPPYVPPTKD